MFYGVMNVYVNAMNAVRANIEFTLSNACITWTFVRNLAFGRSVHFLRATKCFGIVWEMEFLISSRWLRILPLTCAPKHFNIYGNTSFIRLKWDKLQEFCAWMRVIQFHCATKSWQSLQCIIHKSGEKKVLPIGNLESGTTSIWQWILIATYWVSETATLI